jgi:hypothetical protein
MIASKFRRPTMINTRKVRIPPILYLYLGMVVVMGGLISLRLTA